MKYYVKIALQHLAMGLVIPISIIWKTQNGLSLGEAIMTESIVLFVAAIVDLPAGFFASTRNNKRALVIGALLHLISITLLVIGGSLTVFILSAVVMGMAWAFVSGADEAYLYDDFIEEKDSYKKHFSTVTIVDEVFTIIGMLFASLIIFLGYDLRIILVFSALLLAIHFIYTLWILPNSKQLSAQLVTHMNPKKSLAMVRNPAVAKLILLMIAFAVIFEAGRPLWQPHMQELGVNLASFGVLFAFFKVASIAGSAMSRARSFSFRDLLIVFTIMLLSLLVFGLSFKVLAIIALATYLFTENYLRVYMSTELNSRIGKNRAAVLSFSSVVRNMTGALMLVGVGVLSSISIFTAIVALVLIKIPAICYTLWVHKTTNNPVHSI